MGEEEWLAEFIKRVGPQARMRAADNELDYARQGSRGLLNASLSVRLQGS